VAGGRAGGDGGRAAGRRRGHATQGKETIRQARYCDHTVVHEPATAIAHRPKKRALDALRKGSKRVLVEWPHLGRRAARAAFAVGVRKEAAAALADAAANCDGLRITFHGVTAVCGADQLYWNFISRRATLFAAERGADADSEPSFKFALAWLDVGGLDVSRVRPGEFDGCVFAFVSPLPTGSLTTLPPLHSSISFHLSASRPLCCSTFRNIDAHTHTRTHVRTHMHTFDHVLTAATQIPPRGTKVRQC
jgi:hypothetical protein